MILVLKSYYDAYESLLFNEDLDRVKFSLSDQHQRKYNSFDNVKDSIVLIQENKQVKLTFKLI